MLVHHVDVGYSEEPEDLDITCLRPVSSIKSFVAETLLQAEFYSLTFFCDLKQHLLQSFSVI